MSKQTYVRVGFEIGGELRTHGYEDVDKVHVDDEFVTIHLHDDHSGDRSRRATYNRDSYVYHKEIATAESLRGDSE